MFTSKPLAYQTWKQICFFHYPVSPEQLQSLLPEELHADTWDGTSWITISAFTAENNQADLRLKTFTRPPYQEMQVRTYVSRHGEPGVYLLHAVVNDSMIASGASSFAGLPFHHGTINKEAHTFTAETDQLQYGGSLTPNGPARPSAEGSRSAWMTKRWSMWKQGRHHIEKAPIGREVWEIAPASGTVTSHSLPAALDVDEQKLICEYAPIKEMSYYPFRK
ncbi:DUF2071 domain-containing protein [Alkalicoccus chagannorensis]|uniref:DUF2071 domain-containing protein n=1 Tax=Alkalicoccus chagannorensis TaxID=427072 RepID=UPI0003FE3DFA|nr:DUF2071 domain-containing protein [Alkalicoccus chagannorensis]